MSFNTAEPLFEVLDGKHGRKNKIADLALPANPFAYSPLTNGRRVTRQAAITATVISTTDQTATFVPRTEFKVSYEIRKFGSFERTNRMDWVLLQFYSTFS